MKIIKRILLAFYGPLVFLSLCIFGGIFSKFNWFKRFYPKQIRFWTRHLLNCFEIDIQIDEQSLSYLHSSDFEIVISTHKSHLDSLVLWAIYPIEKQLRFVAKKELFKIPLLGTGLTAAGAISIDRKRGRESLNLLREAVNKIGSKTSLLMFPEGTRTRHWKLGKLKKGAFILAGETGRDLLPICINGTHTLMPPGKYLPGSGVVEVVVLPPMRNVENNPSSINKATQIAWNNINSVIRELDFRA